MRTIAVRSESAIGRGSSEEVPSSTTIASVIRHPARDATPTSWTGRHAPMTADVEITASPTAHIRGLLAPPQSSTTMAPFSASIPADSASSIHALAPSATRTSSASMPSLIFVCLARLCLNSSDVTLGFETTHINVFHPNSGGRSRLQSRCHSASHDEFSHPARRIHLHFGHHARMRIRRRITRR